MCKIGKVYVIGLGPGAEKEMTYQASEALEKSEVIIGYTVYTGLIRERFPDKKYLSTPMRQEVVRCEMAMDEAMKGRIKNGTVFDLPNCVKWFAIRLYKTKSKVSAFNELKENHE